MEKQFAQAKVLTQLTLVAMAIAVIAIVTVLGIHAYQVSDPYVREVLALDGSVEKGREMFQINCAGCHGWRADGNVGPSLHDVPRRKSKIGLIRQVTSGRTPPMPKFQPDTQEMADLLSYLEEL